MARIVVTITSDLFDDTEQEASIRENLPLRTLLTETKREFNLPEGNYLFRAKNNGKILDPEKTLEQSGIQTGAVLIFSRERRNVQQSQYSAMPEPEAVRRAITGPKMAFLRDEDTGVTFDLRWQPAIIGRPDASNPESATSLAVNLGPLEGSKTVSRHHARILEQNGQFFLENIVDHNPTYLNDSLIRAGERRMLEVGDKIRVGKFTLIFNFKG